MRFPWLAAALVACGPGSEHDDGGTPDAGSVCVAPGEVQSLDLLFVVDDREPLYEPTDSFIPFAAWLPQRLLGLPSSNFPRLARTFRDAHIGVITTNVGTGGFEVGTCEGPPEGDDGLLIDTPEMDVPNRDCEPNQARFVSWTAGDPDALVERWYEVECIASRPFEGCGARQSFEALRRALVEHRDGPNAGFLRDDSLLAIVFLTKADDCSSLEGEFWNPEGGLEFPACVRYPELLQPVEGVSAMLQGLRPCSEHLFVGVIGGLPAGGDCPSGGVDEAGLSCILEDESMQIRFDPDVGGVQEPACDDGFVGARPSRRIVELQRSIVRSGGGAGVAPICVDAGRALEQLAQAIAAYGLP